LKSETIDEIINALIRGINLLEGELKKVLAEKVTNEVRIQYLNTLKMFIYLLVEFTDFMEKKQIGSKENDLMPMGVGGKKGAKKTASKSKGEASDGSSGATFDWNDLKEKILDGIAKILLLNIQKLWDPPIAEEQFVIFITNLCYKLMETCHNPSLKQQQKKVLKDHLCHILAIMIKKYNHSYAACVMIVQTLPHYEHFSSLYADLIQTCVVQLGYESILPDFLREFRHVNLSNSSDNNPNLKFYSQFLIDLADRLASHLLPYLSLIQDFLDEESYLMRNSVLYIYGELIIKVLNKEATDNDLKLKQMRNELLDTLCEHMHDTNALARSRTLQIWRRICEENAMPLQYMNEVMQKCIGRMEDVASSVRKSAFQLLCDLIRKNPYGIKSLEMSISQVQSEYAKEEAALNKLNEESDKLIEELNKLVEAHHAKKDSSDQESDEMNSEENSDEDVNSNEQSVKQNDLELQEKRDKHEQLVIIQKSKVNYLKDMISFLRHIESAIPKLSQLLFSKTQTDVLEVISFFVTCYEHGLVDMLFGIRKMLSLVLYAEKTIKDAVTNAYKRLYLTPGGSRTNSSVQIAKQLIKLVKGLTVCERDALQELIGEFAASGELDATVIQILWEIFASNEQHAQHRVHALVLLGMIIRKIPEKGRANIQVLIDIGLSSTTETNDLDMLKYSETCLALANVASDANSKRMQDTTNKQKQNESNEPFKLLTNHQLFDRLTDIIIEKFGNFDTNNWIPFVQNAMLCIFKLADNPILVTENIINKLVENVGPLKSLMLASNKGLPPVPIFDEEQANSENLDSLSQQPAQQMQASTILLARFFGLVGIVATKLLVFLNQSVVWELKRRKAVKENQSSDSKSAKNNKNKRKSLKSNNRKSINQRQSVGGNLEEEMGLQGAEAEDVEVVLIEQISDQKVAVNSFLSQMLQVIIHILKEPKKYKDEKLQTSCAMALVRIMLLSVKLCTPNLQLLFTLMEKSEYEQVRSQLILGVGDLVYRFPNALEPWTSHLYMPLRDCSTQVRMNTIRVLSHLILKEMIKTRGQIYEIALCTIDPNQQLSALSKLFFMELSQRNNGLVIYNSMPDIISQLSGGGCANTLTEDSFKNIISYLFTFIKRDKQCETLIEKICHAFRQANSSERKCRDLVFCLSKIQLSDSGIKKLKETFKWYADKLCIPTVYDTFKNVILKNARKLAMLKNETKLIIDELEKQIEEIKQKGLEGNEPEGGETQPENGPNEAEDQEPTQEQRTNKRVNPRMNNTKQVANKKAKNTRRRRVQESSEEDRSPSSSDSD
jgi:condensin complex subunit 1